MKSIFSLLVCWLAMIFTSGATLALVLDNPSPAKYLGSCATIDVDHPSIQSMAKKLAIQASEGISSNSAKFDHEFDIIRTCFEFVRDEIQHSWDYQTDNPEAPATCRASEVLQHKTGFCYAKSHLLAALLRANNIPAGLCYQRLTIADDGSGPPYCLHGLNAVYLKELGQWYRLDPRGLKPGIQQAMFSPPQEALAFSLQTEGEVDFPEIWVEPMPAIVESLRNAKIWKEAADNLPDLIP